MILLADVTPLVKPLVSRIGWSLPLFGVAFIALWLAKALYQGTEKFSFSEQLTEKDNPAFGTVLAGYLIGVTLAMTAAFPRYPVVDAATLSSAAAELAGQGLLIAVLIRAGVFILNATALRSMQVREELVRDRNVGAGAVIAGGCLASGLVLHGALSGDSPSRFLALRDVLVYWVAGQVILVIGAFLFTRLVRFDLKQALERDNNAAAGFSLAGFLIAVGIIVHAALAGAGSDLLDELIIIGVSAIVGLGLLVCAALIAARVFLPESPMAKEISVDKNPAAGLISAALFIAVALLLAQVVIG